MKFDDNCLDSYYKKIYRLSFINRYTNIVRIRNEDVAQHSFFVAAIILKLYDKYKFDLGLALQAAISHDVTEADLSDITHDVKRDNPDLAEQIRIAEVKAIKKYPVSVQKGVEIFESSSVEGYIANLADVIQVQQYVHSEMSLGNSNMDIIRIESLHRRIDLETRLKDYERD